MRLVITCLLSALACATLGAQAPCTSSPATGLGFDGVDDRVSVPYSSAFPTTVFTVSAWVNTPLAGGIQTVISRGEDPVTDTLSFALHVLASGVAGVQLENNGTNNQIYSGVALVADGRWHHLAATRDASGALTLFVDGLLDATHSASLTPGPSTQILGIGYSRQDNGSAQIPSLFLQGHLDQVTLWDVALPPASAAVLGQQPPLPGSPGLVALWRMDDGSGQIVSDSTANGHDGTRGDTSAPELTDPVWEYSQAPFCRPTVSVLQPGGPGTVVTCTNTGLIPGHEYYNLFSFDLCPSGPGQGGLFGLCASSPANLQFITTQLLLPVGAAPFHFIASGPSLAICPTPGIPLTLEVICFDWTSYVVCPTTSVPYSATLNFSVL